MGGQRGHARLRGGAEPHPSALSSKQLQVLSAICDALVPPLAFHPHDHENVVKAQHDDLHLFYRLGAVEAGVAQHVAGLLTKNTPPSQLRSLQVILGALSTRLGSWLLCGTLAPFLKLPPQQQQRVLQQWSRSSVTTRRLLFKLFKGLVTLCFYSMADSNGRNPTWKAIGYTVPENPEPESSKPRPRPLDGKVLDGAEVGVEALRSFLVEANFTILDDTSHLRALAREKARGKKVVAVRCDAVVVGSGSGGGVAAGVLATGGQKVLVLEQGRYFARDDLTLLEYPSLGQMYLQGGVLATHDGALNLFAGSTVGGGSAINWAAALRTPDPIRQEWDRLLGLEKFRTDDYAHALDAVCARASVRIDSGRESFQNAVLRKGLAELGVEVGTIPNNVTGRHECGFCPHGCPTGTKQATSETWLVDAANAGARILTNCQASEILHRKGSGSDPKRKREAVGVVARIGEEILLWVEARATVVACGSLMTPPLLKRSGFTNPHIGRYLRVHPAIMGWGFFPQGRGADGTSFDGPLMTALGRVGSDSDPNRCIFEVPILHPGACATVTPWASGPQHKELMRRYDRTSRVLVLCRDRGHGEVEADGPKRVKVSYRLDSMDAESMAEALARGLAALAAAGASEVGTQFDDGETLKCPTGTREDLDRYLRRMRRRVAASLGSNDLRHPLASAHQMGTCRMGRDAKSGAVDSSGRLWEAERLFVADTSVFPAASGVNPMVTCQAIAFCTARSALADLRSRAGSILF